MSSILDKIVQQKKQEVAEARVRVPLEQLKAIAPSLPPTRNFGAALRKPNEVALIAEVKKASPSKGLIRQDFHPEDIALIYTEAGAAAISVLTDREFFQGHLEYLYQVRKVTQLPLLRKDFIIDEYQIYEARRWGADAVLLIAAILSDEQLKEYLAVAHSLGLDCLVEVHSAEEMSRMLNTPAKIIGVNNRNLHTFQTDVNTTFELQKMIVDPQITLVSESGIYHSDQVEQLQSAGVQAILVGESLMRAQDIFGQVQALMGRVKPRG